MTRMARLPLGLAALVASLLVHARSASAYPQFQFSSGTNRCSECHFSPAGSGLINSWGRDEAGDTISMGGNGAFLHGLWTPPPWLALGADVRLAALRNDVGGPEAPEVAFFPMQLDFYGRVAYKDVSLYVTVGDRGVVRPPDSGVDGWASAFGDRLMSREHYAMWRPAANGPYVRLGRFFAPYGLRLAEHIYYVRRYTGYNLYEETYNLSGGVVEADWEVHASLFVPPPTTPDFFAAVGARESGGAVYAEKRFAGMAAVGLQARIGVATDEARYQGGGVGKLWLESVKLLFLGEADFIRQDLRQAHFGQSQFVSYAGVTAFPVRGLLASLSYERFQEDLSVKATGRNAIDVEVNFFPWAHFELEVLGRYQDTNNSISLNAASNTLAMVQLHYYM
jgi:hypothetical protein